MGSIYNTTCGVSTDVSPKQHAQMNRQECIPVGCVPPTAVAIMGEGSPHPLGADLPGAGTLRADTSPGVGLETPPRPDLPQLPLRCVPGDPPWPDPPQLPPWLWAWRPPWPDPSQLNHWVWAWKPARHTGIPPLETCCCGKVMFLQVSISFCSRGKGVPCDHYPIMHLTSMHRPPSRHGTSLYGEALCPTPSKHGTSL